MSPEAEDLIGLEREWMEAVQRKDFERLPGFLADEYTYAATGHGRQFKGEWLATAQQYDLHSFSIEDPDVRIYGDVAVVTLRMLITATIRGTQRTGESLITDVWVKRAGRWQVVARSSILTPTVSA